MGDKKTVTVSNRMSLPEVLQMSLDPDVTLKFDVAKFLEIDEKIVGEFRPDIQREYWLAYGAQKAPKSFPNDAKIEMIGSLGGTADRRLSVVEKGAKPGEHRCWKRPDELEEALFNGYRQLRGWKDPKKIGYSPDGDGETLKLNNSDKNGQSYVELLGMVIDQQRFDNHLIAVAKMSTDRFSEPGRKVREDAEIVNSGLKHRGGYVKVIEEHEEGQEEVVRMVPG